MIDLLLALTGARIVGKGAVLVGSEVARDAAWKLPPDGLWVPPSALEVSPVSIHERTWSPRPVNRGALQAGAVVAGIAAVLALAGVGRTEPFPAYADPEPGWNPVLWVIAALSVIAAVFYTAVAWRRLRSPETMAVDAQGRFESLVPSDLRLWQTSATAVEIPWEFALLPSAKLAVRGVWTAIAGDHVSPLSAAKAAKDVAAVAARKAEHAAAVERRERELNERYPGMRTWAIESYCTLTFAHQEALASYPLPARLRPLARRRVRRSARFVGLVENHLRAAWEEAQQTPVDRVTTVIRAEDPQGQIDDSAAVN